MSKDLSKFLAYVLRHNPSDIHLELDDEGWASVDEFIRNTKRYKSMNIKFEDIKLVVDTCPKQRYALTPNGSMIRANQGHSLTTVNIKFEQKIPPDVLFHGTATRFLDSIFANGILPQSRTVVHLSSDEKTALTVGQRHGKPIILSVNASQMVEDGYDFFISENNVWLTKEIPPKYISK